MKLFKDKPIFVINNVKWKTNYNLYCIRTWNDEAKERKHLERYQNIKVSQCVIYQNQKTIANEVVKAFKNRSLINIMVLVKTQSGKTGSMCATRKNI